MIDSEVRTPPEDRFFAKIDVGNSPAGCWIWQATLSFEGYGAFRYEGANGIAHSAHRSAYVMLVGPVPEGLQIDHLCRNPSCVNPLHMECVTQSENAQRRAKPGCSPPMFEYRPPKPKPQLPEPGRKVEVHPFWQKLENAKHSFWLHQAKLQSQRRRSSRD